MFSFSQLVADFVLSFNVKRDTDHAEKALQKADVTALTCEKVAGLMVHQSYTVLSWSNSKGSRISFVYVTLMFFVNQHIFGPVATWTSTFG